MVGLGGLAVAGKASIPGLLPTKRQAKAGPLISRIIDRTEKVV
jgi:hypothetical protein